MNTKLMLLPQTPKGALISIHKVFIKQGGFIL